MSRRDDVRLSLEGGGFSEGMARAAAAAVALNRALALMDATWEPHDWTDFD